MTVDNQNIRKKILANLIGGFSSINTCSTGRDNKKYIFDTVVIFCQDNNLR